MAGQNNVAWLKTNIAPRAAARKLARQAVEARLAACANLEAIESVYWWRGRVTTADEVSVVFKTGPTRLRELRAFVERRHPYEVPYITWGAGEPVPQAYARWARSETAGAQIRRRPAANGRASPRTR